MLNIAGLNQFYSGSHTLLDVNFDIPAGSCVCLMGRNGVGKTTLLKCIMGLIAVRDGNINYNGAALNHAKPDVPNWVLATYRKAGRFSPY
jgi:urea transport system ATP-binding protein